MVHQAIFLLKPDLGHDCKNLDIYKAVMADLPRSFVLPLLYPLAVSCFIFT